MKIIHEIQCNNIDAIRLFISEAAPRKNNLRIHYHTFIEISLIIKGTGIYKTNNSTYTIKRGDMFFFRPNEAHCITDIDSDGMELLNLHIAPYYLYTNLQNISTSNYAKILSLAFRLKSNKLNDTLPIEQMAEIKHLFLSIRNEFETKKIDYVPFACNLISLILILISRSYPNTSTIKMVSKNYQALLKALKYIDAHYKEDITLDILAQKVSYNKCYFSSFFKKNTGMSLWDYICIKRIEEALMLIKTTKRKITDVAYECGFNNLTNFNKIFKKYTNLTPNSFRL